MVTGSPFESLSTREKQVIALLEQGSTNKEIAMALGITVRTVEAHLGSIYEKLGVNSRTEAVIKVNAQPMWNSTTLPAGQTKGNPQLKTDAGVAILNSKEIKYRYLYRRPKTKTVRRLLILALLAILVIVIIIAVVASMRQIP